MSTTTLPRFNDLVATAITAHSQNSLNQIVDTMAKVNRMALESNTLCAGSRGPSFRDALLGAVTQVAQITNGRRLRYVELGPEPWKSSAILVHLLAAGVQLASYVGIDINPKSEATMRDALLPIVGAERFAYLIADFYKCTANDIPEPPSDSCGDDNYMTVITNLGFQEGNDLPERTGPMLSSLTRPGDLVLSEMQVVRTLRSEANEDIIKDFYHHPEMRRFSGLVGRQFDPACSLRPGEGNDTESLRFKGPEYLFNLVPTQTEIGDVKVATTLISARINGAKRYVLTNSCLKYTVGQFNLARETTGTFAVRKVLRTGDKSVVFHVAERV
ncbi:hypothetical protein C8R43DRAFT_1092421 [Mycena crocata]|nr:hypothetical protein C8R43DRAFT_1092421 [Mycena crocata]